MSEPRDQRSRTHHDEHKGRERLARPGECVGQRVAILQSLPLEPFLEVVMQARKCMRPVVGPRGLLLALPLEGVSDERRHERPRNHIRRKHREHDGHCQRREQRTGDATEKEDRHEDDADRQRGHQRRHRDLPCSLENRLLDI